MSDAQPTTQHPHEIYSRDAAVHLVTGTDKLQNLARHRRAGLTSSHTFWPAGQISGKPKDAFQIAIKPNIMTASVYQPDSPVYTDPALVEALIQLLRAEGFTQFYVVETQNVYNYALYGPDGPGGGGHVWLFRRRIPHRRFG